MTSPFQSLRWRLQAWHGLILLVAIVALCATVHRLASFNQYRRIDHEVGDSERFLIRTLMKATRPEGESEGPKSPDLLVERLTRPSFTLPAEIESRFTGTGSGYSYFILRGPDGKELLRSDNAPASVSFLPRPANDFSEEFRNNGRIRESAHTSKEGFSSVVGRDISTELDEMRRFTISIAASGLGVWLLGLLGGWWLAGRAIKPIATISRTASRIAEGNLEERIDTDGTDSELDQLGHVLNDTFDRLQAAIERQKRFTADAAHELRTPVSILLSETQRILKRDRTPEEYRDAVQTCHDTAARMRRLTEALLLLARQEAGAQQSHSPCDLSTIAGDTIRQLTPLAESAHVTLHADLSAAPISGDGDTLAILMNNLVANAIQHHRPTGGDVWITTATGTEAVTLTVRDNGPGIPTEHLPHIFQRFHRADAARTGGSGHSGLGLAIAKSIVNNHKGDISAESVAGNGTIFTVRLSKG